MLASPSSAPSSFRRPSVSSTMHWLSRHSTQSSSPYKPSNPTRLGKHKVARSIEIVSHNRSGTLGSGATVVRTPDEALRESTVRLGSLQSSSPPASSPDLITHRSSSPRKSTEHVAPSAPGSPPLPPLPIQEEEEVQFFQYAEDPDPDAERAQTPPKPIRTPPLPPSCPSLRSSLRSSKSSAQSTIDYPEVPPLPANILPTLPSPPFRPILMSEIPAGAVDPHKIIVTLETCTKTYKTTLETLMSRPSHLSTYFSSLFPSSRNDSRSSVYSNMTDDVSTYRYHLTSQGFLPQAAFSVHIFLDRPSAPYNHVLEYLRSPVGTPELPETLPHGVQLHAGSHSRLEALSQLRDEAAYLDLDGLHKLCVDQIRMRQGPRLHARGYSSSTIHSLRASVYSLHTLLERVELDLKSKQVDGCLEDFKNTKDASNEPQHALPPSKSPPTPQSLDRSPANDAPSRPVLSHTPPAGWI